MRIAIALIVAVAALATGIAAPAATEQLTGPGCYTMSRQATLRVEAVMKDLDLTTTQIREMRSRLAGYLGGFKGFGGLDLTPGQIAEMQRRIKAQVDEAHRHPLGWPCKPFKNPSLVIAWVRQRLLDNGFRRTPLTFMKATSRQIWFEGIQDGYKMTGVIAKEGPRKIGIQMSSTDDWTGFYTFKLGFDA